MKHNQLNVVLLFAISLFLCSSSLIAQVTIYQHCNFTGWSIQLDTGNFDSNDIRGIGGLPNDASSIKVPPGYMVTLFSGDNFTGNSITFSNNDSCLVNESFNDVVSSIRVTTSSVLTLFQHCGYSGWNAQFGVGNFNSGAIRVAGGRPNDASSIKIAAGYTITVYRGDNFTGNSITYSGDDDCFVNEGYNDVISSLKVEKSNDNGDWDNFLYPNITIIDEASSRRGSWVFRNAITNPKSTFRALALEGCKEIYRSDNDNLVYAPNLNIYLKDFDGIAYKTGSSPNFKITLSVKWLEDIYNRNGNNLQKVAEDIKGVMSHELTHVYQWVPRVSGSERKGFVEGLADYVRISVERHQGSSPRRGGNWTDGYTTTGHFLNWIVNNKDPEFAIKFNHTARTYSRWSWESTCRNILNEGVQSLWNQYQNSIGRRFKIGINKTNNSRYKIEDMDCTVEPTVNEVINSTGATTIQTKLFPNPTSSTITIEITGEKKKEPYKIEVNDLSGISVKNILCNENQCEIDLSDLPSGIYIITIKNRNNQVKERVIKQ